VQVQLVQVQLVQVQLVLAQLVQVQLVQVQLVPELVQDEREMRLNSELLAHDLPARVVELCAPPFGPS
jgi:hypothetical protein